MDGLAPNWKDKFYNYNVTSEAVINESRSSIKWQCYWKYNTFDELPLTCKQTMNAYIV